MLPIGQQILEWRSYGRERRHPMRLHRLRPMRPVIPMRETIFDRLLGPANRQRIFGEYIGGKRRGRRKTDAKRVQRQAQRLAPKTFQHHGCANFAAA
jgi:hypothetical protein